MNAVVMDHVVIGEGCIIGALSFIKADTAIPARSVYAGNPAKFIRDVSDEMLAWKAEGTALYQQLARDAHTDIAVCTPLSSVPEGRTAQESLYKTWNQKKNT
jgi:carbonic anhydrase/acetyltransferase-like protein (isoleucine patch superfamily)